MFNNSLIATLIISFSVLVTGSIYGQTEEDLIEIYRTIQVDSIVVVANKNGFSIEDFIYLAINDSTFYTAFQNLRHASYPFSSSIDIYNRKNKVLGHYKNKAEQIVNPDGCRYMDIKEEYYSGRLKKNTYVENRGFNNKYFTMKMFEKAFFTIDTICQNTSSRKQINTKLSKKNKYYSELKKLIFFPAQKIDIPMMGQRTQIYSKDMRNFYDFSIRSKTHSSGVQCYSFTAQVKSKYKKLNQRKNTVIQYLELFFSKNDFQLMGKAYHLKFNSGLYKFDIEMNIQLNKKNLHYYPAQITYSGYWKVPLKKREHSRFKLIVDPAIEIH